MSGDSADEGGAAKAKPSRRKRREDQHAMLPEASGLPLPESATLHMLEPDLALISFPLAEAKPPSALTEAEQDIALRVYLGESNEQIASARQSSLHTIDNQLEAIYRKLDVGSRTELVLKLRGPQP